MPSRGKAASKPYLILYLNAIAALSPSLKAFLADQVARVSFKKGEIIYRPGDLCDKMYLIKEGMMRGFFISSNKDITTWISTENELFTSITGYFRNQPARESIQALEETHCEYLTYDTMQTSLKKYPEMKEINRILLEEYYMHAENRAFIARIPNAKHRWNHYLQHSNTAILDRIPKKYIASLLAMRPETLSRLIKDSPGIGAGKIS